MALTPAQEEVLDMLRAADRARPTVDAALRDDLRHQLESGLAPLAGLLERPLVVGKSALGRVLACEAHEVAEAATPFGWTVATARGAVAHKAVELSVHRRGEPVPLELVDAAMHRLEDDLDAPMSGFLLGLGEDERAELRSGVNDLVVAFLELWPPLQRAWKPTTETKRTAELCGGRVVLSGRVDLTLGAPTGTTAGRVVVDLKTGRRAAVHVDDLRYYALLDTLRVGVPPLRLAGHYLDSGTLAVEEVTPGLLEAAVRRTVAGATKLLELALGLRSPAVEPGPPCRWCVARRGCEGAARWRDGAPDGPGEGVAPGR